MPDDTATNQAQEPAAGASAEQPTAKTDETTTVPDAGAPAPVAPKARTSKAKAGSAKAAPSAEMATQESATTAAPLTAKETAILAHKSWIQELHDELASIGSVRDITAAARRELSAAYAAGEAEAIRVSDELNVKLGELRAAEEKALDELRKVEGVLHYLIS
jgi:hypothetical protein